MIDHLDHLVLTTCDEESCIRFYVDVLGMTLHTFGGERKALHFGNQKINLHYRGQALDPKANVPMPGSLDLCFIASIPLGQVIAILERNRVAIVQGPIVRTGAVGPIRSIYVRDPDLNLIEISELMQRGA